MTNDKLDRLQQISPPAADATARERAFKAASLAFDREHKKNRAGSQGFLGLMRLTPVFLNRIWEFTMERRMMTGALVSSVFLVPVAAYLVVDANRHRIAATPPGYAGLVDKSTRTPEPVTGAKPAPRREAERAHAEEKAKEQAAAKNISRSQRKLSGSDDAGKALLSREPRPVAKRAPVPSGRTKARDSVAVMSGNRGVVASQAMRAPALAYKPDVSVRPRQSLARQRRLHARIMPTPPPGGRVDYAWRPRGSGDRFAKFASSPLKRVAEQPVSTFSADVDTASYAFTRRLLRQGRLPVRDAVRVEEFINYFSYGYAAPDSVDRPFKPTVTLYPTPWNKQTKLLHIGIKGFEVPLAKRPPANLVFLIDVSGSMSAPDKLPLLKSAFRLLVGQLGPDDTVSIVTYAGRAGTVLEPTKGRERHKILAALDNLRSGGSTAGAAGINQAYALAERAFRKDGSNRVILATDGDFNVGVSSVAALKELIEVKRKSGVFLSVLGFGQGNLNDALMQALAQNGNGNAAYIDSLSEARKVLVEQAGGTLTPIAKDVKFQIEFNPDVVSEYRLIGYETRALKREDFNNDKKDAGDIGSGHTVTAIYELTPKGAAQSVDPLRYKTVKPAANSNNGRELGFLKMRYKLPNADKSRLITIVIEASEAKTDIAQTTADVRFATAVAAFGQKLRGETRIGDFGFDEIERLAQSARGADVRGYRAGFLELVRLARSLHVTRPGQNR